jgi:hypothetical protein
MKLKTVSLAMVLFDKPTADVFLQGGIVATKTRVNCGNYETYAVKDFAETRC